MEISWWLYRLLGDMMASEPIGVFQMDVELNGHKNELRHGTLALVLTCKSPRNRSVKVVKMNCDMTHRRCVGVRCRLREISLYTR